VIVIIILTLYDKDKQKM